MILAYAYCFGSQSPHPELCLIPSKPDNFSVMVRVESLIETRAAILRLSPTEGVKVTFENDGGLVVTPCIPSKLYLTPSQPDRPGFPATSVKILRRGERQYETLFKDETREAQWRPWKPNENSI